MSLPKLFLALHHHILSYPTPPNLSYAWSFGGLALVVMTVQILSGIFLAMHYSADVSIAFYSVEQHIMRDVNGGWFVRYLHANGASFLFALMYIHMARALYYKTYNPPRQFLWMSGVVVFFLSMAAAFLGYVLPWGQMSFWGATVITNLFSAIPIIGNYIAVWLWGGFSVGNPTLIRFFGLHFMIPFIILAILTVHVSFLHEGGSTNTVNEKQGEDVEFAAYFVAKDILVFAIFLIVLVFFICYSPNSLGHPDNAIPANPLVTPAHIVPEWYFLPFYAILKSVPNKRLGVLLMAGAILVLFFYTDLENDSNLLLTKGTISAYWYRSIFWLFSSNFLLLGWIGAMPAQEPYVEVGGFLTVMHFLFLLFYSFWFPRNLFIFLNSVRLVIKEELNKYLEARKLKKNILKSSTVSSGSEENTKNDSRMVLDNRTIMLWWIFLVFTVGGIECFLDTPDNKEDLLFIAKYIVV